MLADANDAYDLRSVSLRYFNAAGADPAGEIGEAHDPETHLIPLVLAAARDGTAVTVFGDDYDTQDGHLCARLYPRHRSRRRTRQSPEVSSCRR